MRPGILLCEAWECGERVQLGRISRQPRAPCRYTHRYSHGSLVLGAGYRNDATIVLRWSWNGSLMDLAALHPDCTLTV